MSPGVSDTELGNQPHIPGARPHHSTHPSSSIRGIAVSHLCLSLEALPHLIATRIVYHPIAPAADAVEGARQPPQKPVDGGPAHAPSVERRDRPGEAPGRQRLMPPHQTTAKAYRGRGPVARHHLSHLFIVPFETHVIEHTVETRWDVSECKRTPQ